MHSVLRFRSFHAVCFLAAAFSFSANASSFSTLYVFGDSLSDVGNAYLASGGTIPGAPYSNGRFTNGNTWVQDLAPMLGVATPTASLAGGTDYAVGGAQTGNANPGDLTSQLSAFKAANPVVDPNGLYMIWIGANDLNAILGSNPSQAAAAAEALAVVGNIDNAITNLSSEGAKNFLVVTVPDLGKTPAAIATGPAGVAASTSLSLFFDNALVNGYSAAGIPSLNSLATLDGVNSPYVVDAYSLLDAAVADPGLFGFTNVTQPCLTGEVDYSGGTACADPNQYLFWDQLHPTAAGQEITADAAFQELTVPEPSTLITTLVGGLGLLMGVVAIRRKRTSSLVN